jgi:hypothetical protein
MKRLLLLIAISTYSLLIYGQELSVIQSVEKQFIKQYEQLVAADILTATDSLAPAFRNQLAGFLKNPATFEYSFEELSKYLKITSAPDASFRIFGYDEFTGGHWHEMINIAQIKLPDGRVITEFINTSNDLSLGDYNDVIIYQIHPWGKDADGNQLFLFVGWGSHGPKQKFETAEVYMFNGVHLEPLTNIFYTGKEYRNELATPAPRSAEIDLQVDIDSKTVRMNQFRESETGWMQSREPVTYSWNGRTFDLQ